METPDGSPRPAFRGLRWLPVPRLGADVRRNLWTLVFCALAAAVVAAPVAVERSIESVKFRDTLGTLTVEFGS